jgi:hypothetical protein
LVKIIDPGTIVRKHETYSEHLRQKIVQAPERGFLDTCVYGTSVKPL